MTFHIDKGQILSYEFTPEGFLRCYGRIAKVGSLTYFNKDGFKRIERVEPEVLFDKKSIDSFKSKPITNDHPPIRLDSSNVGNYMKGLSSNIAVIDGDFLGLCLTVTDKLTIDDIVSGRKRQLSCGYDSDSELLEDGTYKQINRKGNHIAVVERGRVGESASIKMDSEDFIILDSEVDFSEGFNEENVSGILLKSNDKLPVEQIIKKTMRKFKLDGIQFETEDEELVERAKAVTTTIASLTKDNKNLSDRIASFETERTDSQSELETLKGKFDILTSQASDLQKSLEEAKKTNLDSEAITRACYERMDTWNKVLPFFTSKDSNFKPDYKLDVADIQKLYLQTRYPNLKLDSEGDAYIKGSFEVAIEQPFETKVEESNTASKVDAVLENINTSRKDAVDNSVDVVSVAAQKYADDVANAWKTIS